MRYTNFGRRREADASEWKGESLKKDPSRGHHTRLDTSSMNIRKSTIPSPYAVSFRDKRLRTEARRLKRERERHEAKVILFFLSSPRS